MNEFTKGVIFSCSSTSLSKAEIHFFGKTNPFGFILFSRNFKSKKQIKNLIVKLKKVSINKNPLIFVDQEGGRVQRFKNTEFTKFPEQKIFGDLFLKNRKLAKNMAYLNSRLLSYELKEIGVDVNCSPVLDIFFEYADKIIGDRSFSYDPEIVSSLGEDFCKGHKDSGILTVLKHFPGHGKAKVDSHKLLPIVNTSIDQLIKVEILPFLKLKNEVFLMLAHIVYKKIDNLVAPYSSKLNLILVKNLMKYKGLVISDDISMKALSGTITERTENCYIGGCDIILYCSGKVEDMKKIYKVSQLIDKKKFVYFKNYYKKIKVKKIDKKKVLEKLKKVGLVSDNR